VRSILGWLGAVLAVSCSNGGGIVESCLSYEPAIVQVEGRLLHVERFGPPGYGEDPEVDQRVSVPILQLAEPTKICGDPDSEVNNESFDGITEVQLDPGGTSYRMLIDADVVATGTLSRAVTGHHYTEVILRLTKLERD
jgi:Domain of unknown function (DUF4431)